jgi:hypothetical protein
VVHHRRLAQPGRAPKVGEQAEVHDGASLGVSLGGRGQPRRLRCEEEQTWLLIKEQRAWLQQPNGSTAARSAAASAFFDGGETVRSLASSC